MQKSVVIFLAGLIFLLCPCVSTPACAQQWDASQKEVWATVEGAWEAFAKGDLEGTLGYYHPDYVGWTYTEPIPSNKEVSRKWLAYIFGETKTAIYDLRPAAIEVHTNFAIAHYFITLVGKTEQGEEKTHSGRWTDIYIKQDGRWLLIGDHGGWTSSK